MEENFVEVDGSFGEGGGQIIRNAVTLAIMLKKKLKVSNIRANRPKPGLASQHLQSFLALLKISGAKSSSLTKGSTTFDLHPLTTVANSDDCNPLETTIDLVTAGSVTLCCQGLLPFLQQRSTSSKVTIIGGTHVLKAPNTDYMQRVFLRMMKSIGYDFSLEQTHPGYFPRGGGQVILTVNPNPGAGTNPENRSVIPGKFPHFALNSRGHLLRSQAILNLTPPLLKDQHKLLSQMKSISDKCVEVRRVNYASVEYFLEYEHTVFGFYRLCEGRPPKPTLKEVLTAIDEVEAEVTPVLTSGDELTIDEFMQDQLIIYMTLAKLQDPTKVSYFTTLSPVTDHTLSAIHVSQQLTNVKFNISEKGSGLVQITL